jgi:hypothetical protein
MEMKPEDALISAHSVMNKHKSLETEVSEDHRIQAKGSVVCKQLLQDDKEPCLLLYIKERRRRLEERMQR